MDASLRRAFLPLPRMRTRRFWKNRQQMTMAARMQKRRSIKQKTIDFSTTPYRSVHFRQFFESKRSRGWEQVNFQPCEIHMQCTARNTVTDGVEQRMVFLDGDNGS